MAGTAVVVYGEFGIAEKRLAEFAMLEAKMVAARNTYTTQYNTVMAIANQYYEDFAPKEVETVLRLRREIRSNTRGTPVTVSMEHVTAAGYIRNGTEQLYNANMMLVVSAFRKVASIVHPDRPGGDNTLFQQAVTAYRLNDLVFLQELFLRIKCWHDVRWRITEGVEYLRAEIERPAVSLRLLQQTPEFGIVRAVATGSHADAAKLAVVSIRALIVRLHKELLAMARADC